MYVWNTRGLADDLRARRVPEPEKFRYFLAFMFISSLATEAAQYMPEEATAVPLSGSALVVLATLVGTSSCYIANRQGDNECFMERFICLSLPVLVRTMVVFTVLYTAFLVAGALVGGEGFEKLSEETTIADVVFFAGVEIAIFVMIRNHILNIARRAGGEETDNATH